MLRSAGGSLPRHAIPTFDSFDEGCAENHSETLLFRPATAAGSLPTAAATPSSARSASGTGHARRGADHGLSGWVGLLVHTPVSTGGVATGGTRGAAWRSGAPTGWNSARWDCGIVRSRRTLVPAALSRT